MPCGGIFPAHPDEVQSLAGKNAWCFYCTKTEPIPDHWVIEWDSLIHGDCIPAFLKTEEGECVLSHGHAVIRRRPDGDVETLYEEK